MREDVACAVPGAVVVQLQPSSNVRYIEAFGESHTLAEWAVITACGESTLRKRLSEHPPEVALAMPSYTHVDATADPGAPRSWTWDLLPWEDDVWARRWVATHPSGATLDEVGDALGVVRERVRQIEETAKRKLRLAADALGLSYEDLVSTFGQPRVGGGWNEDEP